jgi:hypothetical protein
MLAQVKLHSRARFPPPSRRNNPKAGKGWSRTLEALKRRLTIARRAVKNRESDGLGESAMPLAGWSWSE